MNDQKPISVTISKLKICPNYGSLIAMENDFNSIGLTIIIAGVSKLLLCKIIEGKPSMTSVLEDYVVVGDLTSLNNEISERVLDCLITFVINASSGPSKVVEAQPKSWQNGPILYGTPKV